MRKILAAAVYYFASGNLPEMVVASRNRKMSLPPVKMVTDSTKVPHSSASNSATRSPCSLSYSKQRRINSFLPVFSRIFA